jgi:hypothetical protein
MEMKATPVAWTCEHDTRLRVSAGEDLAVIRSQVEQGIARLWECTHNGQPEAWVVTRIDGADEGAPELVIVLGEGKGFFNYMPLFVQWARSKGLEIRTHVKRRGLIRMWSRLGVELDHYVLKG